MSSKLTFSPTCSTVLCMGPETFYNLVHVILHFYWFTLVSSEKNNLIWCSTLCRSVRKTPLWFFFYWVWPLFLMNVLSFPPEFPLLSKKECLITGNCVRYVLRLKLKDPFAEKAQRIPNVYQIFLFVCLVFLILLPYVSFPD